MRKLIAMGILVCAVSQGFAARDFSEHLPFHNVVVRPYDQVSAYKLPYENNGKKIVCTMTALKENKGAGGIEVQLSAVNLINAPYTQIAQLDGTRSAVVAYPLSSPVNMLFNSFLRAFGIICP